MLFEFLCALEPSRGRTRQLRIRAIAEGKSLHTGIREEDGSEQADRGLRRQEQTVLVSL